MRWAGAPLSKGAAQALGASRKGAADPLLALAAASKPICSERAPKRCNCTRGAPERSAPAESAPSIQRRTHWSAQGERARRLVARPPPSWAHRRALQVGRSGPGGPVERLGPTTSAGRSRRRCEPVCAWAFGLPASPARRRSRWRGGRQRPAQSVPKALCRSHRVGQIPKMGGYSNENQKRSNKRTSSALGRLAAPRTAPACRVPKRAFCRRVARANGLGPPPMARVGQRWAIECAKPVMAACVVVVVVWCV